MKTNCTNYRNLSYSSLIIFIKNLFFLMLTITIYNPNTTVIKIRTFCLIKTIKYWNYMCWPIYIYYTPYSTPKQNDLFEFYVNITLFYKAYYLTNQKTMNFTCVTNVICFDNFPITTKLFVNTLLSCFKLNLCFRAMHNSNFLHLFCCLPLNSFINYMCSFRHGCL